MALLAEEIVEEWLNRRGYFTIRGAKTGVDEIGILAIRPEGERLDCRHVEVQASTNPVSWLAPVIKQDRRRGVASNSARARSPEYVAACVDEWLEKKFFSPKKGCPGEEAGAWPWTLELVVHRLKHPEELDVVRARRIVVHDLARVVREVLAAENLLGAAGHSLIELIGLDSSLRAADDES
jgi:hypothetical protein